MLAKIFEASLADHLPSSRLLAMNGCGSLSRDVVEHGFSMGRESFHKHGCSASVMSDQDEAKYFVNTDKYRLEFLFFLCQCSQSLSTFVINPIARIMWSLYLLSFGLLAAASPVVDNEIRQANQCNTAACYQNVSRIHTALSVTDLSYSCNMLMAIILPMLKRIANRI